MPFSEMSARYLASLTSSQLAIAIVVLSSVCWILWHVVRTRHEFSLPSLVAPVLLGMVVSGALHWGWHLRWLGDDAFISFRYAQNFANGHGLVFNPGERVEGYTNFLWTFLIGLMLRIGASAELMAICMGLASFGVLLAVMHRLANLLHPDRITLSPAVLVAAACYPLASFATSGLETMFAAMLALVAVERAVSGRYALAGTAGILATMAHPDHALLYAALGGAILLDVEAWRTRRIFHHLATYAAPFLLLYIPYFLWRWSYYGDVFPNTYYAKSANLTYFSQGGIYLLSFLIGASAFAALPTAIYGAFAMRKTLFGRYVMLAVPIFCIYVAKIGGDFMYGRLLCPLIAPVLLATEYGIRMLLAKRRWLLAWVALALLGLMTVPTRILLPMEKKWMLADERTFYELESLVPLQLKSIYFDWAQVLNEAFSSARRPPTLAISSCGMVAFYTGFPMIDRYGLNDRHVARQPITRRGRPGHEKSASSAYVISRRADIADVPVFPAPYEQLTRLQLERHRLHLVRFDPELLDPLKSGKIARFTDIRTHIDRQLQRSTPPHADQFACDAWFFETYYFDAAPEDPRRARVRERLLASGRPRKPPEAWDSRAWPRRFPEGYRRLDHTALRFDATDAEFLNLSAGEAARWLVHAAAPDQAEVAGNQGSFLNTFQADERDGARIVIRSRPFIIEGDVMELWVGGGQDRNQLRVELFVDGVSQYVATGCNSEVMGRRWWVTSPFIGKKAVLEIRDDSGWGWGHLVVDELVQWKNAAPGEVSPPQQTAGTNEPIP